MRPVRGVLTAAAGGGPDARDGVAAEVAARPAGVETGGPMITIVKVENEPSTVTRRQGGDPSAAVQESLCYCGEGEPRFKSSCLRCRLWDKFFGASGVSQEQVRAALGRSLERLQQKRQGVTG